MQQQESPPDHNLLDKLRQLRNPTAKACMPSDVPACLAQTNLQRGKSTPAPSVRQAEISQL